MRKLPMQGLGSSGVMDLESGPLPVIPKSLWAEIQEWITAWKHVDALREAGLMLPGGLLLHGPTGTGKTSLARAVLKYMPGRRGVVMEAHNILDSHFGSSAQGIAAAFAFSEQNGCLLVIEEIDSLGLSRIKNKGSCANEENKITIALMRHLEAAKIPIIATTNLRESLDPALLRRFELQIEVPPVDDAGRAVILRKILGKAAPEEWISLPLNESIRLAHRMRRCEFIKEREASS